MKYYVTLFDSNYLTRGLVMYYSLLQHAGEFHLWIICFDELAYNLLNKLHLKKVTLVSLSQFEDNELLAVKRQRTHREYCWTCTPSTALYVLNTEPHVDAITYLDADLMFFSSLEPIYAESGKASILITEHRYSPEFDQSSTSGIYNVQFVRFRRNLEGLRALTWWRDRCLEWCFAYFEDNKFGDQKYLDDWTERFTDVHVVQHLGAGLAPWNVTQYALNKIDDQVYVENEPLIFYHFHALQIHHFNIGYVYGQYTVKDKNLRQWIYQPYLKEIGNAYKKIRIADSKFKRGFVDFPKLPRRPNNLYKLCKAIINDIQEGRYC